MIGMADFTRPESIYINDLAYMDGVGNLGL